MSYSHNHGHELRKLDIAFSARPGRKIKGNEAGALVACIAFTSPSIPRETITNAVQRARSAAGDSLELWEALARQHLRESQPS